VTLNILKGIR